MSRGSWIRAATTSRNKLGGPTRFHFSICLRLAAKLAHDPLHPERIRHREPAITTRLLRVKRGPSPAMTRGAIHVQPDSLLDLEGFAAGLFQPVNGLFFRHHSFSHRIFSINDSMAASGVSQPSPSLWRGM